MLARYRRPQSVRPSVGLVTHACLVTKCKNILPIFWYHSSFLIAIMVPGRPLPSTICGQNNQTPFGVSRLRPLSAYNVSTIRTSEKKFNYCQWEIDHALSKSYRWSAYVTPSSPKGGSKENYSLLWIKINGYRINFAKKLLCGRNSSSEFVAEPFPYLTVYGCSW